MSSIIGKWEMRYDKSTNVVWELEFKTNNRFTLRPYRGMRPEKAIGEYKLDGNKLVMKEGQEEGAFTIELIGNELKFTKKHSGLYLAELSIDDCRYKKVNKFSSEGCYVATSVYGSYDCPEVWTLRRFRDNVLSHSWLGRGFIKAYYAVSPGVVKVFGNSAWFNRLGKVILDKIIQKIKKSEEVKKNA